MKKLIILFIAALLSTGAYAADTGNGYDEKIAKLIARNTMRGYHGFVDLGMGVTLHDFDGFAGDSKSQGFGIDILTSHGFQFNNFFFLGGGAGITECTETNIMVPIFANMRINILNRRISPVIDIKGGYAVGDHDGAYISANICVRIGLKKRVKSAMYVMAEMSYIGDSDQVGFIEESLNNKDLQCERFMLRVGYEF